jgi:PAS domain S-box-containing protein
MPSWIWKYGFAFLVIALTLILSELITPHFAFPGTLFLCAVMLAVWVGGLGPGLLASVLSTLAFRYQFRHPLIPTLREMPTVSIVFLSNILIALMTAAQRSAKESLRRTGEELKATVQNLLRTNEAFHSESREREQAEKRLRRSEAYMTEAQTLSKTGSWAYDPATKSAPYWSDEMFRIHGLQPEQGPPTSEEFLKHVHPGDRERVSHAMINAFEKKGEYEAEYRTILPNGAIAHIHARGHLVLNSSGDVAEVMGSAVDITERKRAEQERERFRQLEADLAQMNRVSMLGELAAGLAHEIKQPITAVITNANTSLRWLNRDNPDLQEAREAIIRAANDGKRAGEIIQRLRSFYRKGAPPKPELVDLNELAREIVVLLREEANRHSISVSTELALDAPIVTADRVQLQQVCMNLMLNGIEAMKDAGGTLTIKSELDRNGRALISITDTGVGLPTDNVDQIFEAFFTTKSNGSGMGLAISRSIIESHGGRLWATRNSGSGATFHFSLPIRGEELKAP